MNISDPKQQIQDYLAGQMSPEEEKQFDSWLKQNPEGQKLFKQSAKDYQDNGINRMKNKPTPNCSNGCTNTGCIPVYGNMPPYSFSCWVAVFSSGNDTYRNRFL